MNMPSDYCAAVFFGRPSVQEFTVLAAVRSDENRESGRCFSTSGWSNSATCRTEHLVSLS